MTETKATCPYCGAVMDADGEGVPAHPAPVCRAFMFPAESALTGGTHPARVGGTHPVRETDMPTISRNRHDTIRRAIDLIDNTAPADLWRYLAQTTIHDHLKQDPPALRRTLADAVGTAQVFGAWKAAQQLLKAAGQPY